MRFRAAIALLAVTATSGCNLPETNAPVAPTGDAAPIIVKTGRGDLRFQPRHVENGACTDADCVDFKRVDQAPGGYALVHKIFYEGSEWLLIDIATGAQQTFSAPPHFSPDRQRVIALNVDETGDGAQSGSFIYERRPDGMFAQVAHFPMAEFVPVTFGGWISADCANIAGFTGWGEPGFETTAETGASISYQPPRRWSLMLRSCPGPE